MIPINVYVLTCIAIGFTGLGVTIGAWFVQREYNKGVKEIG